MNTKSAYNIVCGNLQGPEDIKNWQNNVMLTFPNQLDYVERGLSEEEALTEEINAYMISDYKNATALFCAFKIVKQVYLKARRVKPEDTQQRVN